MKKILFLLALTGAVLIGNAQTPVIYSVDRAHAPMEDVVSIVGANFGSDASALRVTFGGTNAEILSVSPSLLEVRVPAGATSDELRVTHIPTGRSGSYAGQFFLNYQGEHGISTEEFSGQTDFQAQKELFDLCVCDFDNDGKPDVATASRESTAISVFRNISVPGTIDFTTHNIQLGTRTMHVRCGDLNGDGLQDLVLTEEGTGSRVFVLTNIGDMKFSTQVITVTGVQVKQIALTDLDLDGRVDIVLTNNGSNAIQILPNESSVSTTSFGAAISLTVTGAPAIDAIATGDLNGDGYPDIVTSQFQEDLDNQLYIFRNRGNFSFDTSHNLAVNAVSDIRLADLNGDGRPEVIATQLLLNNVLVFENLSDAEMAFNSPKSFATHAIPGGIDIGDFDGDGKPDLAIGGLAKAITIFNNTTTGSAVTLNSGLQLPVTYINRAVRSVDMDGDGKPDIVFASVDDKTAGVPVLASMVSVIRNTACMVPVITPGEPLEICEGTTVTLQATAGGGVTYTWYREGDATPIKSGAEAFLTTGTAGTYTVHAQSPGCDRESNAVTITTSAGSVASEPNARSNSPVCTGNTLTLEVDDIGGTAYRWTGPGGFVQTTASPSLERTNFTEEYAGRYVVEVLAGTCVARTDFTLVESITVPHFNVSYAEGELLCEGDTKKLSLAPALPSGFTAQWYNAGTGAIAGAEGNMYSATATGEYYAVVTPDIAGCAPTETQHVQLTALIRPTADFDAPETACIDEDVQFVAKSIGDPGATITRTWSVDGNPADITHSFPAAGEYDITLTVSYSELPGCHAAKTSSIQIVAPQVPEIAAASTAICEGSSTTLSIDESFSSVVWNDGTTTSTITAEAPGVYSLTAVDAAGCNTAAEITIAVLPPPNVTITANRTAIAQNQEVELSAAGAVEYVWMPGKDLNDSTVADPVARPRETTVYTVTGTSADGCTGVATITIQVSDEAVAISVPVLFSPNGDGDNEMLIVEGIESYPDCTLQVYDRRGRKVYGVIGYQNNWDGSSNGTPLPQGVYYYVVGCPGKSPVTGSVAIVR